MDKYDLYHVLIPCNERTDIGNSKGEEIWEPSDPFYLEKILTKFCPSQQFFFHLCSTTISLLTRYYYSS
jgi:hypothetical protein